MIVSESGLVTEITKTLPVYVNVFDSQGVLINNNLSEENEEVTPSTPSYELSYDWGYFYETKDGEIERVEVLTKASSKEFIIDFAQDIFSAIKKKSFSIFCNVYNITDNSTRRLASEVQPIQFVSEHRIDLEPQTIFISTKDNGAYGGNDNRKYSFSFKLKDRNDAVLPFVNETDLAPQGDNIEFKPVSVSGEVKYWSFTGEINVSESGYNIWEDDTLSSQYCEFSFTYCGFTYSAGVTIAKNLAGKSNYNIFIESSSGNILSIGDTSTILTTKVYYASEEINPESSSAYEYVWKKNGIEIARGASRKIEVNADSFEDKVLYSCEVSENGEFIGSASYSLMDITETKPVSLILKSELPQNTQTKDGILYSPNFEAEPLVIEPSLFIGRNEEDIQDYLEADEEGKFKKGRLVYEVGNDTFYYGDGSGFVNAEGKLNYSRNLSQNITIEAYIVDFTIPGHTTIKDTIAASNPITILFLEKDQNVYLAAIESSDGREHFEDANAADIILTAKLYYNLEDITEKEKENYSFAWSRLLDDKVDNPNTDEINEGIIGTEKTYTVTRNSIINRDLITCVIKNNSTGTEYIAKQFIYDFTDEYRCDIIYDKPLLLNESNKIIKFSATAWHKDKKVEELDGYHLSYHWFIISENQDKETLVGENSNIFILNAEDSNVPQKQAFVLGCQIKQHDSTGTEYIIASNAVSVQYAPEYAIKITPKNIFIPTSDDGSYEGNASKKYEFNFQLVDAKGIPIAFDGTDANIESAPVDANGLDGTNIKFIQKTSKVWDFTGIITLDTDGEFSLWRQNELSSRAYEFIYFYYGQKFTEEVNIIKNVTGKGNYSVTISSSSGLVLSSGDTSTKLIANVYYNSLPISSGLEYKWYKNDEVNPVGTESFIEVEAGSFTEKVTYTCKIFSSINSSTIIGSAQITLTDLTDTLPVYLMLESNLDQNLQVKEGDLYTPKFSGENNEIIVTPSLFVGREEQYDYYDKIYYQVGETNANGNEINYSQASTSTTIWVDNQGRLHYNKDLTKSITIEAYIDNYPIPGRSQTVNVQANNPINIMFVESGGNEYTATIKSSGGREHFEESKQDVITLTAELRKGGQLVSTGVTYKWDIVTDTDSTTTTDDSSTISGLTTTKKDFVATGKTLNVSRSDVSGAEVFICTMTLNDGSGLSFTASKVIRDFMDSFQSQIIADTSLILTPSNTSVNLTNQVWNLQTLINDEDYSNYNENRFNYEWWLLRKSGDQTNLNTNNKTIKITAGVGNIPTDEVFSILGKVTIDGKTTVTNYVDIRYQPTIYTVEVSPKTFFAQVANNGDYNGSTFTRNFTFKLLDEAKNPLKYNISTDNIESEIIIDSNTKINFTQNTDKGQGLWFFDGTLTITPSNKKLWSENTDFKIYDFGYNYLGQPFSEEIEIIKAYAGQNGQPGQNGAPGSSGYTIDLSNEFHAFAGGEMRADPNQDTSTIISAFLANEPKKISKIWIGEQQIYSGSSTNSWTKITGKAMYYKVTNVEAKDINNQTVQDVVNVKLELRTPTETESSSSSIGFLTETGPIILYIQLDGLSYKLMKTFNYTINYNSKSYYLNFSPTVLKQKADNSFDASSISVSALSRDISGEAVSYAKGVILYAVKTGSTLSWKKITGGTGTISGYSSSSNLKEIKLRLYSAKASFSATATSGELSTNAKYLLDEETIPVLKSMDGYVLGGENLIRWSKTLPIGTNKWVKSSSLSVGQEEDFSTMIFSSSGATANTWLSFRSPKIRMTEDYYGRDFCFSCLVKLDSTNPIDEYASISVAGYLDSNSSSTTRNCYKTVGTFKQADSGTMQAENTWTTGEWIKIYKVFKLKDLTGYDDSVGYTDIQNCDSFNILFYLSKNGSFQIKQPKLELGNIPSSWSSSPYDINFEDISGGNLVDNGYQFNIKTSQTIIYDNLSPNTNYSLSWANLEPNATITCYLGGTSKGTITSPYTFNSGSASELTLAASTTCTARQLKLEKGLFATPFFFDETQINALFNESSQSTNNFVNKAQGILDKDGNLIIVTQENLSAVISDLQKTISESNGEIIAKQNQITSNLELREQAIKINDTYKGNQAIILSSEAFSQGKSDLVLTSDKLVFLYEGEEVAYLSNKMLYIENGEITQSLKIGNIKFIPTENGTAIVIG